MWNAPTSYTALYNVKCTNIIHCFVQYEMHQHHTQLCTMWNTSTSHPAMYYAKCTNIIHDFVQCKMHQHHPRLYTTKNAPASYTAFVQCEMHQHHTLLCTTWNATSYTASYNQFKPTNYLILHGLFDMQKNAGKLFAAAWNHKEGLAGSVRHSKFVGDYMITDNYFTEWVGTSTRRVSHYLTIGSHYELMQPIEVNVSGQAAQGGVVLLALWQTQALRETVGHDVSVDRQRTLHYVCVVCTCVRACVIKWAYPCVFVSDLFSWQFDQNDWMISLFISFLSLEDSVCVWVHKHVCLWTKSKSVFQTCTVKSKRN